jgi:sugar phosphate isomerase/epimerase
MKKINLWTQIARRALWVMAAFLVLGACKPKDTGTGDAPQATAQDSIRLSLAQWSMHRMIWEQGVDPYSFAEKAHAWGFEGLEYVSSLYYKELEAQEFSAEAMAAFVAKSNESAQAHGMKNLLIMIDGQGNLAAESADERKAAAENHHKWVDAAAAMGCHSIRVNLAGSEDPTVWVPAAADGLKQLATYAATKNIHVIVENHGGLSSNAAMLAQVMTEVGMDNCGTLPDFGNFCIRRADPADWGSGCAETYDRYQGVQEMMPFAKAVSAKSHDFDEQGNEINTDYARMMGLVIDAGYRGFVGVEYEGSTLSEEAGILATKALLEKVLGRTSTATHATDTH